MGDLIGKVVRVVAGQWKGAVGPVVTALGAAVLVRIEGGEVSCLPAQERWVWALNVEEA